MTASTRIASYGPNDFVLVDRIDGVFFAMLESGRSGVSSLLQTNNRGGCIMDNAGIGWIAAIIIGGFAGWLAEKFMKSDMGVFMNILLGIVGAAIASAILSALGVILAGWIGYLLAGFIGACVLIWIGRLVKGKRA